MPLARQRRSKRRHALKWKTNPLTIERSRGDFLCPGAGAESEHQLFRTQSPLQNPAAGTPRCLLRRAAKKTVTVRLAAAVAPLSLVRQQHHLALHSTGIAPQRTARAHNPVTRHKNRNGVAPHDTRHGTHTHRRARPSVGHAERQGTIRHGRGKRHIEQLAPHGQLKWGAAQIEIRQGRQWKKSREVSAQPLQRGLDKGRQIRNRRVRSVPFQGNALRPGFRLVRHWAMAFALEP